MFAKTMHTVFKANRAALILLACCIIKAAVRQVQDSRQARNLLHWHNLTDVVKIFTNAALLLGNAANPQHAVLIRLEPRED